MNGIINVYKEKGFTSFDVCAKLRGILKQKKIGHTGTLDPDAEGVLPVCVGNATKLCDMLTDKDKVYEAVLTLGITTDTEDMTGEVLERRPVTATYDRVLEVIEQFIGTYDQIPPMYSALKVNGQKLYELARQGKVIERKPRTVTIHAIEILEVTPSYDCSDVVQEVRMRVSCSKGTYIRSLCRDIGEALQCGGCMKSLIRTKVSIFTLENALRLAEIEECVKTQTLDQVMLPVDQLFLSMPKVVVKKEACKLLYNGNQLKEENITWENDSNHNNIDKIRVYDSEDVFTGIYEYDKKEELLSTGENVFIVVRKWEQNNMEYIYGSTEFKYHNTCVTLGKFDGLHRGHQYLLSELAKFEQQGLTSVMFTFDYHPGNLFSEKEIDLIYTEEEKKELLSRLGPKVLISYPFTEETASMEPEDFIKEVLIGKLDAKAIVIGTDYRFGRKRKGDAAMLKEYSDLYGYKLVICEKLTYHDKVISSTRIREELKNGQMESVNEMLGHPYTIMGTVVTGNKIGRTIGVPTVNLLPATHKLLPPNGVYASSIKFQGNTYFGVTNIGYKPTVGAGQSLGVETHIFGFTGDLYGKSIEVELYRYERPETKFNSVEELKQKVQQDIENVKDFFANQKGLM